MITILTIWMICWWITEYPIIQNFITNTKNQNYWINELLNIFSCWKCTTFTVFTFASLFTLSSTFFAAAFICSFASMLVQKAIKKYLD